MKFLVLILYI